MLLRWNIMQKFKKNLFEIQRFYLFKAFKQLSILIKRRLALQHSFPLNVSLTLKMVSVCERKLRELRPLQIIIWSLSKPKNAESTIQQSTDFYSHWNIFLFKRCLVFLWFIAKETKAEFLTTFQSTLFLWKYSSTISTSLTVKTGLGPG